MRGFSQMPRTYSFAQFSGSGIGTRIHWRQERLKLGDKLWNTFGRHQPDPVLLDLAIIVSQHVSLGNDLTP